jgi:hypothetical protein
MEHQWDLRLHRARDLRLHRDAFHAGAAAHRLLGQATL